MLLPLGCVFSPCVNDCLFKYIHVRPNKLYSLLQMKFLLTIVRVLLAGYLEGIEITMQCF